MQAVTIDRDKYIGGSDIPIIMGISPFKKRFDLLLEKTGLKENDFTGNEYTEYGNVMEPKIRDFINENREDKFEEGKYIENDIRCHTDGINGEIVLEIKTTSQIHEKVEDYKVYLVQLLFYMEYTKRKHGKLAIYERPDDFNEEFDVKRLTQYDIRLDDFKELVNEINQAVDQFRIDLAKVKDNPFITEEELMPDDLNQLLKEFINNKSLIEALTEKNKQIVEKCGSLFTKAGAKTFIIGNKKATYTLGSVGTTKVEKEFNVDKFKEENEELYNEYVFEVVKQGKTTLPSIKLSEIKESKNETK